MQGELALMESPIRVRAPLAFPLWLRSLGPRIWIPLGAMIVMALLCFLGPWAFDLPGPNAGLFSQASLPPFSAGHLFGTDNLGDDLLSRVLYGGRDSIEIAFGANLVGIVVGGTFGLIAGYFRGWTDTIIMRCVDVLLAFPALILALGIATYLGPTEINEMLAISVFTIPAKARLARVFTLRLQEDGFTTATQLLGATDKRVVAMHLAPNVALPLLTYAMLNLAAAMLIDAGLSFLGAGVRPPTPTWGNLIATGEPFLGSAPWLVFVPSAFLFVMVLASNMLGDALRARLEAR